MTNSKAIATGDMTLSRGVYQQTDGTWLAMNYTRSRYFATLRGAVAFLVRQGVTSPSIHAQN